MKTLEEKIVKWLKAQLKTSNCKGFIVGLSGGLDSAVVAALAKRAAGKNLVCVIMPVESHKKDLEDAKLIAKRFKLKTQFVELTPIYESFIKLFSKPSKLAKANLKARLRMIVLYCFANKLNYLVVGTGNKSELMMGYFTKYGDGGVDLLPLGGILKTDVKKLAKHLKVPETVIRKAPSAGLWQGQTDEAELGITYCKLDEILECIAIGKRPKAKKQLVDKVIKRIMLTEHKREMPKVC